MIIFCFIVSHKAKKVNNQFVLYFAANLYFSDVCSIKNKLVVDFFKRILYNVVKGSLFMEISF